MAFFTPYAMLLNDKIDVANDVLLRNGMGRYIVVMGKEEPHLLSVIANDANRIMFGHQRLMHRLQGLLCSFAKPYLTVLIFFRGN